MPSLKAIRKRIASVKNTQQITKAMKMVSAAKLRRAQDAVVAARPYAEKMGEILRNLAQGLDDEGHPLLRRVDEPKRVELVIVTADRGLCGAYNASLVRQAERYLVENRALDVSMTIVGRKGNDVFKRREIETHERHLKIPAPTMDLAAEIAGPLRERFAAGEVDRVDLLYAEFRSALTQVPTIQTLLPVAPPAADSEGEGVPQTLLLEPDAPSLLARLLPQVVEIRIFQALLEAQASEHGARMTAMDSATRNAGEMIFKLTLDMNRARQAAITTELMEIVSGAEALRG